LVFIVSHQLCYLVVVVVVVVVVVIVVVVVVVVYIVLPRILDFNDLFCTQK